MILYTFISNYIFFLQFGRLRDEADKQNPEIGELLIEEPREICINEIKRFHRGKSEIHLGDESNQISDHKSFFSGWDSFLGGISFSK